MKRYLLVLLVLVAAPLAAQNVSDISFDSVPDFFKLPAGMNFGEVPGVAVDSRGHVYVFTRSNTATGPAYAPAAAQLARAGAGQGGHSARCCCCTDRCRSAAGSRGLLKAPARPRGASLSSPA